MLRIDKALREALNHNETAPARASVEGIVDDRLIAVEDCERQTLSALGRGDDAVDNLVQELATTRAALEVLYVLLGVDPEDPRGDLERWAIADAGERGDGAALEAALAQQRRGLV